MAELDYNPAVNPVVISDFTSNAAGRRYNSTTDDLLDRIREVLENGGGGGGGGTPSPFRQIIPMWVTVVIDNVPYSSLVNVVFKINNSGLLDPLGFIINDEIVYLDEGTLVLGLYKTPFILNKIGRLNGDLSNDIDFNPYENTNLTTAQNLLITRGENNIFSLEVVVLPETILNESVEENYFELEIDGIARKYFLESFNGIPIINRIFLEDFGNIETVRVTPNTGIILEYTIKHTYPNLP